MGGKRLGNIGLEVGQAQPLDLQHVKMLRLNEGKVDHIMDLFSQHFLKDVMEKTTNFDGHSNGDCDFVCFFKAYFDEIKYLMRSTSTRSDGVHCFLLHG